MYSVENYSNTRFNVQFKEIRNFLQKNADTGFHEHFHWGRLDWMMAHSYLDVERLPENALFRDMSSPVLKCKKTPRKKCSFVAEVKGKG